MTNLSKNQSLIYLEREKLTKSTSQNINPIKSEELIKSTRYA